MLFTDGKEIREALEVIKCLWGEGLLHSYVTVSPVAFWTWDIARL